MSLIGFAKDKLGRLTVMSDSLITHTYNDYVESGYLPKIFESGDYIVGVHGDICSDFQTILSDVLLEDHYSFTTLLENVSYAALTTKLAVFDESKTVVHVYSKSCNKLYRFSLLSRISAGLDSEDLAGIEPVREVGESTYYGPLTSNSLNMLNVEHRYVIFDYNNSGNILENSPCRELLISVELCDVVHDSYVIFGGTNEKGFRDIARFLMYFDEQCSESSEALLETVFDFAVKNFNGIGGKLEKIVYE